MRESTEAGSGASKKGAGSQEKVLESKSDTDRELSEIRREVIESRNLVIKTDNLLKNIHAEVKAIGKRNDDLQHRQWISSGVAYAVFAVLCVAGAIGFSSARVSGANSEQERLEKSVADLSAQLEKQKAEAAAIAVTQRAAGDVYRMMTTLPGDERLKGADALAKLDTSRLSPLEKQALTDRAAVLRKEIGQTAFERGKASYRRGDVTAAAADLTRFVALNPDPQELLEASFYLGAALNGLKKHEQAVPYLSKYVSEEKRSKNREQAMLSLAQSLEQTGNLDKSLEIAREALATYPDSAFVPQFRSRISSVKRRQQATGEAPPQPGAPASAPPAAPQAVPNTAPKAPASAPASPAANP